MTGLKSQANEERVTILDEFPLKTFSVLLVAEADFEHDLAASYDRLEARRFDFFAIEPRAYLIHRLTERRAGRLVHGYGDGSNETHRAQF